ncbi:MAG: class I adenylate-forming enzyme family protein [Syntrophales bacterium]
MVLGDFLKKYAAERPDREAVVFQGRRFTFRDYDRLTDRVAAGLLGLGVRKGDRVGIYMPNWPENVFFYLGAAKIGAVAVPVSWRFTPQEVRFVIDDAGISVLAMTAGFLGMDFVRNLAAVRDELPSLRQVVILETDKAADDMIPYENFLAEAGPDLEKAKAAVQPDDPTLFIYTSGTTGVPKASVLTHRNLISYTDGQIASTGFSGDHRLLLNIPLNHVGGAVMAVVACLNAGNTIVMMDMFNPEETLKTIEQEKISVIGQVPAQYALELLSPNVDQYSLQSIQVAIVSSQPCPSELILAIRGKMGVMPRNAYGLTEVSGAVTFTHPDHGEEKLKYSVGRAIPGVDLVVMDERNNILPTGQVGEIAIKGDPVMKGYWKRPDEDRRVFDDKGYFHTGDMGRLEEDDSLVIVGRKKEMFIRGGENVYPPEVEEALAKHPDVLMSAVVGRPDPVMGEVGRAYIMPKPGTNPTAEGIKAFLKDRLANYKIPEDVIFRAQLPLTLLGKVKKLDLYEEIKKEFEKPA